MPSASGRGWGVRPGTFPEGLGGDARAYPGVGAILCCGGIRAGSAVRADLQVRRVGGRGIYIEREREGSFFLCLLLARAPRLLCVLGCFFGPGVFFSVRYYDGSGWLCLLAILLTPTSVQKVAPPFVLTGW